MPRPDAYICLWEYVPPAEAGGRGDWRLVECYGVDDNGYAVTKSKHAGRDRYSYEPWLNRKVWYADALSGNRVAHPTPPPGGDNDWEWEELMGRAVTAWTPESGVRLAGFHPPEWAVWLSPSFYDDLRNLPNWAILVAGGYTLKAGTVQAVEKMIYPEAPHADRTRRPPRPGGGRVGK